MGIVYFYFLPFAQTSGFLSMIKICQEEQLTFDMFGIFLHFFDFEKVAR
jgi:hypothetical protein